MAQILVIDLPVSKDLQLFHNLLSLLMSMSASLACTNDKMKTSFYNDSVFFDIVSYLTSAKCLYRVTGVKKQIYANIKCISFILIPHTMDVKFL